MTALFGLGLIFTLANPIIVPLCVFASKFGLAGAFNGVYLSSPWLYPPGLLSSAFGLCNVSARTVTIIAPMVAEIEGAVPMIMMCSLSLISMVLIPLMKISQSQEDRNK